MLTPINQVLTNKFKSYKSLLFFLFLVCLTGCPGEQVTRPSIIMRTAVIDEPGNAGRFLNTLVTSDGVEWNRFVHTDIPENTSGSMDRDKLSRLLYLTFFYEKPDGSNHLMVKWALGNQNWASEHSELAISPPAQHTTPQIFYLTEHKFIILWRDGNRLHTALLDAGISSGENLFLGETIEFNSSIVGDKYFSATFHNGMVHILCMTSPVNENENRAVNLVRGQINNNELSFFDPIFTNITGDMITNLLAEGDSLHFVLNRNADSNDVSLVEQVYFRSIDGNNWQETKVCQPSLSYQFISDPLFFRDGNQQLRYLRAEIYSDEGGYVHPQELVRLVDCTAQSFNPLDLGLNQFLRYSAGEIGLLP
jgi:hypothetical protein